MFIQENLIIGALNFKKDFSRYVSVIQNANDVFLGTEEMVILYSIKLNTETFLLNFFDTECLPIACCSERQ